MGGDQGCPEFSSPGIWGWEVTSSCVSAGRQPTLGPLSQENSDPRLSLADQRGGAVLGEGSRWPGPSLGRRGGAGRAGWGQRGASLLTEPSVVQRPGKAAPLLAPGSESLLV